MICMILNDITNSLLQYNFQINFIRGVVVGVVGALGRLDTAAAKHHHLCLSVGVATAVVFGFGCGVCFLRFVKGDDFPIFSGKVLGQMTIVHGAC